MNRILLFLVLIMVLSVSALGDRLPRLHPPYELIDPALTAGLKNVFLNAKVSAVTGVGCGKNAPVVQTEICTQEEISNSPESPPTDIPETTPWNLAELYEVPTFRWLDQSSSDGVRSLFYQGLTYKSNPTEVFAYYCSPKTLGLSEDDVFPAVVLVHGGGGHAFSDWVRMWASRGYAAISMDLDACGPDRSRLPNGGPTTGKTDKTIFRDSHLIPITDQWPYHALANVIRAHSLVRSFAEVDPNRTAITGISWGGYLTCIAIGLDNRFKAAVPVYGCGFLHVDTVWKPSEFDKMTPERTEEWIQLWDPSMYIGLTNTPTFFVNGSDDSCYWLGSYAKTYGLVKGIRNFRIQVGMLHGHHEGWKPREIELFIDQYLQGGTIVPTVGKPQIISDNQIRAKVKTETKLVSASVRYTTESRSNVDREWHIIPAEIHGNNIIAKSPPIEAEIWFVTVSDQRGAEVSSELVFGIRP
ncbi:alpha/beta hydrolase family protein [Planctomycetota bacterium]